MFDPLSCLREYTIKKQPIIEKNNFIIFGEYCWPKSVKTNYQIFNKQRDATKEYYTLECLLFFLNNLKLSHVAYVNFAKKNEVAFIRRPDRKKLLAYLMGEISTSPSIDTSVPAVCPTKIKLEHQKEIADVVRDSNFQSSFVSFSEAGISRNKCQSSYNHNCIVVAVKPKTDEQEKINTKPVKQEAEEQKKINTKLVKPETEEQEDINSKPVKPEAEEHEEINTKPSTKDYSVFSSTEANFTVNEKQFPSLQRVKQVKEDHGKINKKQRTENSFRLSSSEDSISRKEDQRYFNHDCNCFKEKQEAEEKDETDVKPSTEELLLLLPHRRNISLSEEFSTPQRGNNKIK